MKEVNCQCGADLERGLVLDPFLGSGTSALAAKYLNRDYSGFEPNKSFYQESLKRLSNLSQAKLLIK